MKKLFFSLTAMLFVLMSCSDTGTSTSTSNNNTNDSNLVKNREVYKAIETGDVTKIKEFLHKDAVDHGGGPNGSDITGGDSILAMLSRVHTGFSDIKMEVITDAANADYIFSLVKLTGTTNATPVWGMPPNTKIESKTVDVVKIKDGKATDHWGFLDPKDMAAMMGGDHKMDNKMAPKDTTKK